MLSFYSHTRCMSVAVLYGRVLASIDLKRKQKQKKIFCHTFRFFFLYTKNKFFCVELIVFVCFYDFRFHESSFVYSLPSWVHHMERPPPPSTILSSSCIVSIVIRHPLSPLSEPRLEALPVGFLSAQKLKRVYECQLKHTGLNPCPIWNAWRQIVELSETIPKCFGSAFSRQNIQFLVITDIIGVAVCFKGT